MGKWIHKLSDVNREAKTATCACCGKVDIRISTSGKAVCRTAIRIKNAEWQRSPAGKASCLRRDSRANKKEYRSVVGMACSRCGFVASHQCQIDVHHKDGNHSNNSLENLEAICSNCHRLETASKLLIPAHLEAMKHAKKPEAIEYHRNMALTGNPLISVPRSANGVKPNPVKSEGPIPMVIEMSADLSKVTAELKEVKKQLAAMTDDYSKAYAEAANQELENWFMKDESSKVRWLAAQWNLCKQTKGGGEYDQTQS